MIIVACRAAIFRQPFLMTSRTGLFLDRVKVTLVRQPVETRKRFRVGNRRVHFVAMGTVLQNRLYQMRAMRKGSELALRSIPTIRGPVHHQRLIIFSL